MHDVSSLQMEGMVALQCWPDYKNKFEISCHKRIRNGAQCKIDIVSVNISQIIAWKYNWRIFANLINNLAHIVGIGPEK